MKNNESLEVFVFAFVILMVVVLVELATFGVAGRIETALMIATAIQVIYVGKENLRPEE